MIRARAYGRSQNASTSGVFSCITLPYSQFLANKHYNMANTTTTIEPATATDPVYFFGAGRANRWLSQMYACAFEHDGTQYENTEQYFQVAKAQLFQDKVQPFTIAQVRINQSRLSRISCSLNPTRKNTRSSAGRSNHSTSSSGRKVGSHLTNNLILSTLR